MRLIGLDDPASPVPDGWTAATDPAVCQGEADELFLADLGRAQYPAEVAALVRLVRPGGRVAAACVDPHDLAAQLLANRLTAQQFGDLTRGKHRLMGPAEVAAALRAAGVVVDRVKLLNCMGWASGHRS